MRIARDVPEYYKSIFLKEASESKSSVSKNSLIFNKYSMCE